MVNGINFGKCNKNSVCIVAYHMIPNTRIWGASQRMYYLANQLVESGIGTTVISGVYGKFSHKGKHAKFKHIPVLIKPKFIQKRQERVHLNAINVERTGHSSSQGPRQYVLDKFIKPVYRGMERFLFNDWGAVGLFLFLWNKQAFLILNKEIVNNDVKVIVFSGPYFTCFRLVKKIKKKHPHVKIILDYRDPWNLLKVGSFVTNRMEQNLLNKTDLVSFFSDKFRDAMCDRYEINRSKCLTMYNGYDARLWETIAPRDACLKSDKFIISYTGSDITFEPGSGRDPGALMRAVSGSKYSENILLNLVGCKNRPDFHCNPELTSNIKFLAVLPHKDCLKILRDSHVAVILSSDEVPSDYTVTGKLFDCLRSGAYLLGIANSKEIDYRKIIKNKQLGVGCNNDVTEIRTTIENIYLKWRSGSLDLRCSERHDEFSRYNQNNKLIERIKEWL